jgi:hypothetical protein
MKREAKHKIEFYILYLEEEPIDKSIRGRPRKRWIAGIEEDMQIVGIRLRRKQLKKRSRMEKNH